ncbi:hypothetical protein [Mesorhizobium sp. YM1C-6-2]|uniref:hypothetical protein n=1 Tax=Mesorhizobium sp. YM1C-6-2 TaxID=1827501 RepID=UPI000EF1ACA1|nr:hypothetical protein [Mesorhizobium sp. YM1C-6-2]RLP23788.1 hypothetical protein D8676_19040 [Mesorhizobium sp. YM1C-6-2]
MSSIPLAAPSANPIVPDDVKPKRLLRRREVPKYLEEKHGIKMAEATLAKAASVGGGPPIRYFGRIPYYEEDALDRHVLERLSKPVNSTAERDQA